MNLATKLIVSTCVVLPVFLMPALAQQGIKRTVLGTLDFPPGYQTIKGLAEIAKGACAGRHTHFGIETSYILEGEGVSKIDGKPDQPYKAGDSVEIPAGVIHDGCATTSALKILTVHVVEKGKPLGTPVP
jgi:quercetin dioxygenase-like cupin family protein